jgi:hypothetical protein
MNEFLIELDKFYQTYKSKTEFELGFQKQKQKVQILKFILKFIEFEPNSKLNWISFELIQRKKKNLTIHSGLTAAHSYIAPRAKPSLAGPRRRKPGAFEGKRSPGDGLHAATREPRSGGREGSAHRRSRFYGSTRVGGEEASVRGRRSGRGGRRSGWGGAPWRRGTRCEVGRVGE